MNWEVDVVALALMAATYLMNEVRKIIVQSRDRKKKNKGLDDNILIDSKIYPLLWEVLTICRATRVYIKQFHNGANFYTGQSIQRETVSHEVALRGIQKINRFYDNVLISEMDHKVLYDMKRGDYFHINERERLTDNVSDWGDLKSWMEVYGLHALFCFRISDPTGQTVATLNIHFDRNDPLNALQIAEIMEIKKSIENIFYTYCR